MENIAFRKGINILDLACGSGFPLFELAHTVGSSCRLTGIDIWKQALARAKWKQQTYALTNVMLVEADGANMPFADAEFDLIVSNLGINNFSDPQAVVNECARVLKPGGAIA